jgi:hypothetical protein
MKLTTVVLVAVTVASCGTAPAFEGEPYGAPLTLTEITDVSTILATPDKYVGERVLIEGEVTAVCEMKGCWMDIETADDARIQVKVEDDVIVFPVSARGKTALVEGIVEAMERTSEQAFAAAAHRAEEQGEAFDSTAVFAPETVYRIQGSGALIRD